MVAVESSCDTRSGFGCRQWCFVLMCARACVHPRLSKCSSVGSSEAPRGEIDKQRELRAIDWRHACDRGDNNRDSNRLGQLSLCGKRSIE